MNSMGVIFIIVLKIKKVQQKDLKKKNFLISLGYKYVSIQECIFKRDIKEKCDELYNSYLPSYFKLNRSTLTYEKVIKDIENGTLFGVVEVDINVKSEYLKNLKNSLPFFVPLTFQWRILENTC